MKDIYVILSHFSVEIRSLSAFEFEIWEPEI